VRRVTPMQNAGAARWTPRDTRSGSAPASRAVGGCHLPPGGRREQVVSRPGGFAGVFMQILLDSGPVPVRIMGTCRVTGTVDPREARIRQGGIGS